MSLKGTKQTPEHIAKRMESLRKSEGPAKSAQRMREYNKSRTGQPLPQEQKDKIAKANKGKQYALGFHRSLEFKQNLSKYWAEHKEEHNHYKDGKAAERESERVIDMNGLNYRLWRNGVYEKDEYTCQVCGQVNGNLNAHHIKEYAKYPELRYEISNGVTLCKKCHILYHQADREYIKRMEQEVAI